jgi:branched-chain amino acid transport system substrate-binding protein
MGGSIVRKHHKLSRQAFAGITLTGVMCITALTGTAGAQTLKTQGVTDKSVKIGFISSNTGVAAPNYKDAAKACEARVGAQNAKGGVNGRKIDLITVDDQSSGANLTAAQNLVTNQKVFAVVDNSPFDFLSYRYLLEQGIPQIGGGTFGQFYGQKGNENIIPAYGNAPSFTGLTYDNVAKVMKQLGATKSAAVAYGANPSSTAAAKATQDYAVPALGLKAVLTNTSLDFGTTDVGPVVLGIKNSGADAVYLPLDGNTNLAIIAGLKQNNVAMKANMMASGYGQEMLDSPVAQSMDKHDVVSQVYKPTELKNDPGVKEFRANLKKYAGLTEVPDYGQYTGYIDCDLAITGLEQAGKNLTGQGFVDGLHKLGTYNPANLECAPIDISLTNFGKAPGTSCSYFMYVKDGHFVVMNKGKPVTGKLVGDPQLLEENTAGPSETTTTAAPTTAAP